MIIQPSKGGRSFSIVRNFHGNPYSHRHNKNNNLNVKNNYNLLKIEWKF
jgi:hypothetical protein